ncbi:MAG TPA: hypothetical protein PLP51_00965 [Acholeplasmataceae bacterium]|nr:hypothetical protein [Acholeplasmataceae bacterium]HQC30287.1 hypothetical protein [Acholeplasmataceae bacterium]
MKIKRFLIVALFTFFSLFLISCNNNQPNIEPYEFKISDMVVYLNDEPAKIQVTNHNTKSKITYTYDKKKLRINNDHIECFYEGKYTIKAELDGNQTEFEVQAIVALEVPNLYAWIGYPDVEINPIINIDELIRYETSSDKIEINGNKITALKPGKALVKAIAGRFERVFWVTSLMPQTEYGYYYWGWGWETKAKKYQTTYEKEGTDGKTTIFIGDSFFDPICFTYFDDYYQGKDALCFGISASTSQTWELLFKDLNGDKNHVDNSYFSKMNPKNIVIQLGNNNIYNDLRSAQDAAKDLQALLTLIHGMLPETNIYLFAVTPRVIQENLRSNAIKLNEIMHEYALRNQWFVYLDTNDEMTPDKLSDGIHPDPDQYYIFVYALAEAGIEIDDKE